MTLRYLSHPRCINEITITIIISYHYLNYNRIEETK